jgi:hypothetical protein
MLCLALSIIVGVFKIHDVASAIRCKWGKDCTELSPLEGAILGVWRTCPNGPS